MYVSMAIVLLVHGVRDQADSQPLVGFICGSEVDDPSIVSIRAGLVQGLRYIPNNQRIGIWMTGLTLQVSAPRWLPIRWKFACWKKRCKLRCKNEDSTKGAKRANTRRSKALLCLALAAVFQKSKTKRTGALAQS